MKKNLLELTLDELKGFLTEFGEPAFRAKQIVDWIWRHHAQSFAQMNNLPSVLRQRLSDVATIGNLEIAGNQTSNDGTTKLLFVFPDGQAAETVILPYDIGDSVCLSTQIGCKMGCMFCASGLPGFIRNLEAGEILSQLHTVRCWLSNSGRELKSIVIMGSGEPLENWHHTLRFLEIVRDPDLLGMSLRHVTLSTAGLVPKIIELSKLGWPLNLAVSLHAGDNETRSRIMPINKKYPLEVLISACDQYAITTGRRVTYEYILIDGINDDKIQAQALANLLAGRLCHVNLIPLNPVPELQLAPSPQDKVRMFRDILEKNRIHVTVRRKMGTDIAAACGQLRNNFCGEKSKG